MVSMMFETGSSNNYGHYSNATVDELSEKLKATFDETERTDIAKQICAELVKDRAFDFVGRSAADLRLFQKGERF